MSDKIKERGFTLLSILVLSLLVAIALLSTIFILPFAIVIGAVFSIREMLKWRKKQSAEHYKIGKVTFIKEPLSFKKVIRFTFRGKGFKQAG